MTNADSVKARLKNQAKADSRMFQDKLIAFALERAIYRISISDYADHFTLKGGIFLYAVFDKQFVRATRDIDLEGQRISNDVNSIKEIFMEIFSLKCDDAIYFDLNTLDVKNITEFKEYHGVNVTIMSYLDHTRIPVSIDIGFGDVVFPDRVKMEFPVLLDMDAPSIFAYSLYSVVAEKFEAMTSLGLVNSRYKDFYDIYVIAASFDLNGRTLKDAIVETFSHRQTGYQDIVPLDESFPDDPMRQTGWNAFISKKKATREVAFADVMNVIRTLMIPIVKSIQAESEFRAVWNHHEMNWD